MGVIAVNATTIEIGAVFLAAIVAATVAFWVHMRVLGHQVERRQAELRAQWALAVISAPVVADRPQRARLEIVPDHPGSGQASRARASDDESDESPVPRRAVG